LHDAESNILKNRKPPSPRAVSSGRFACVKGSASGALCAIQVEPWIFIHPVFLQGVFFIFGGFIYD